MRLDLRHWLHSPGHADDLPACTAANPVLDRMRESSEHGSRPHAVREVDGLRLAREEGVSNGSADLLGCEEVLVELRLEELVRHGGRDPVRVNDAVFGVSEVSSVRNR